MALAWLNASHYAPWLNFEAEAMAFAGLVVCGLALTAMRHVVEVPLAALAPLACAALVLAQWAGGLILFGGDVVVAWLFLFALAVAITLGYQLGGSWRVLDESHTIQKRTPSGSWLWVPALASAMVGLLQWLGYSEALGMFGVQTPAGFRAIGNMAQPNQLATLMLFGVCAAWYDHERLELGRVPLALLVGFLSVIVVLSQSRTALLGASAMGLFVALKLRRLPLRWRTPWWVPLTWAAVVWLSYVLAPSIYSALLLGSERATALGNLNLRHVIWNQLVHALSIAPWWGWGWNQTSVAQHAAAHWYPGDISYNFAHNLVLDLLVWFGLPVGGLLAGLLAWWFATRASRLKSLAGVAAYAALIPMAIHSLLEFPFAYAYFLVTAGVLAGLVERDGCRQTPPVVLQVHPPAWVGTLCGLGLAGSLVAVEYHGAQDDFRVARFRAMRVGSEPIEHEIARLPLLTQIDALLRATRTEPKRGMEARDIAVLRDAALRFSYQALDYRLVRALALNGDIDGAVRHLETVRSMYGSAYHATLLTDLDRQSVEFPEFKTLVSAFHSQVPPNPAHVTQGLFAPDVPMRPASRP